MTYILSELLELSRAESVRIFKTRDTELLEKKIKEALKKHHPDNKGADSDKARALINLRNSLKANAFPLIDGVTDIQLIYDSRETRNNDVSLIQDHSGYYSLGEMHFGSVYEAKRYFMGYRHDPEEDFDKIPHVRFLIDVDFGEYKQSYCVTTPANRTTCTYEIIIPETDASKSFTVKELRRDGLRYTPTYITDFSGHHRAERPGLAVVLKTVGEGIVI